MRWKGMMGRTCLISKSIEIFPRPCTGESPFTYSTESPNLILCQLTISNDYLLDQVLKFYGICLITKLTFAKSTWKLDYSSGGGSSQTLLVILMIWWHHGIPEYKLYYFPKGLLSLLPTFAFPKILSETSFLRAPQDKEMSRTTPSGSLLAENFFWSRVFPGLTFHGFHSSQLHKEGSKGERGPAIGKGIQTEDTVAQCPTNAVTALTPELDASENVSNRPWQAQVWNILLEPKMHNVKTYLPLLTIFDSLYLFFVPFSLFFPAFSGINWRLYVIPFYLFS